MAYLDSTWMVKLAYDWQTLIAGGAAIFGGWLAYRAGVKQANETRRGAEVQAKATSAQTAALEKQNAELRLAEQSRLAQDRLIVARMLHASLGFVINDVAKARARYAGPPDGEVDAVLADQIRHEITTPHFEYLWERVGTLARDEIVVAFLDLETAIDRCEQNRAQPASPH